ncbi:MAG: electron transport complex protein RnfG [Motiliproteus sp.]|jgi:electron transport complex protein RnfG
MIRLGSTLISAIRNNALALGAFAVLTAGAIALTQAVTRDLIIDNREQARSRALFQIVPEDQHDNDLIHDSYHLERSASLGYEQPVELYLARRDGRVHTVILPVIAANGYSGNIDLIVGIRSDESVAGVRILRHQETPGLGDKVDIKKSQWVLSFNGTRLQGDNDPSWAVKKDGGQFDQFTGATITPRAVVNGVRQAILTFRQHRVALLQPLAAKPPLYQEPQDKTPTGDPDNG